MRKPEQLFYDLIKKYLPGDISRIENIVDNGTPDLSCAAYGRDYWVELKSHPDEEFEGIDQIVSYIEPTQKVWHARRTKVGSLIFVICRFKDCIVGLYAENNNYYTAFLMEKKGNTFDWEHMRTRIRYHCDNTTSVF